MKKMFKSAICQMLILSFLSFPAQSSMYEQTRGGSTNYPWNQPVIESGVITGSWGGDPTRQITIGEKIDELSNTETKSVAINGNLKMYTLNVVHALGGSEGDGFVVDQTPTDKDFYALGIDCGARKTKVVFVAKDGSKAQPLMFKLLENNINKYMSSSLPVASHDDLFMLHNNSAPRIGWDNLLTVSPFSGLTSYAVHNPDESMLEVALVNNDVLASPDSDPFFLKKAERGFYPVWDKLSSLNYAENEKYYNQQEMGYLVWAERVFRAYSSHNEEIFDKLKESSNVCIALSTSSTTSPVNRQRIVAALKYVFENIHGINANGRGLRYYVVDSVESADLSYLYEQYYKSNSIVLNIGHSELSLSGVNPYTGKLYNTESWYGMGGATIDRILCNYFEKKIRDSFGIDLSMRMRQNIQQSAVWVKEQLSADGASILKFEAELGDDDFECEFSIDEFNKLLMESGFIDSLKEKVCKYAAKFIDSNNSGNLPITAVFSGSAIRSPIIKQSILEAIGELGVTAQSQSTLNFDECSAYGGCYAVLLKDLPSFVDDYTDKAFGLDAEAVKAFDMLLLNYNNKVLLSKVKNELESFLYGIQKDGKAKSTVAYSGKTIFDLTCEILEMLKGKNISMLIDKLDDVQQQIQRNNMNDSSVMEFRSNVLGFWARLR